MIIAINYCNARFETQRKYNTATAYTKGKVDRVIEYSLADIDAVFYERNQAIFAYERGAGLWLWKPYIILQTLREMQEGDYLFYCDAGAYYVDRVHKLVDVMEREHIDIMPFEIPFLERQFTKKETFVRMDYGDYTHNQICTTCMLLKKNDSTLSFISQWLTYMQDEICVSYRHFTEEAEFPDFVSHREDQSIFSLLCRKHHLQPFRDPSQYGDRPWEYAWMPSYEWRWKPWTLSEKKYPNSPYPKIIVSNRKFDPLRFQKKERYKSFLWRLGLYNRYYYKYRFGALI